MDRPICIFLPNAGSPDPTNQLKELFADEIGDHKVALISIAGSCREGKSFLLNFFIRYLRAAGEPDWLEHDAQNGLNGFRWERTRKSVTQGILIWPEYFKIRDASGEEIVVILMDTQGLYDANTSIQDSTSLFALSVMLSSVQIFNVKENIKADHLNNLELFTEFSRRISESSVQDPETHRSPFQKLIFLVRDWSDPAEHPYGWTGGDARLSELFEDGGIKEELRSMRDNIKDCFESMQCFLMPYPGVEVARSPKFRGELSDIDDDFKVNLKIFIEDIFRSGNLKPKKFDGEELRVRQLAGFVNHYVEELRSGEYPTIERLYTLAVTARNDAIVNECYERYLAGMSENFDNNPQEPSYFEMLHDELVQEIRDTFDAPKKLGGQAAVEAAWAVLMQRIASKERKLKEVNSSAFRKKLDTNVRLGKRTGIIAGLTTGCTLGARFGAQIGGSVGGISGGVGGAVLAAAVGGVAGAALGTAVASLPCALQRKFKDGAKRLRGFFHRTGPAMKNKKAV